MNSQGWELLLKDIIIIILDAMCQVKSLTKP